MDVDRVHGPTLTLIYLPHLDYCLQKFGPNHPNVAADLRDIDWEVGRLLDYYAGSSIILLSEYGIAAVDTPIHLNRLLREKGFISVREELGLELLDCGASQAFAVADHQLAHVYVNDPRVLREVRKVIEAQPGIDAVYAGEERRAVRLDHPRAGDLVVLAKPNAWFTYYYWLDDVKAPDFARTVDIHRKPGYDPAELFLDPKLTAPKLKIAWTLLRRKLGMRAMLDVIGLNASIVRGSHGATPSSPQAGPFIASNRPALLESTAYDAPEICGLMLRHLQSA
jgi:predicted AlkP superfamily pyrophosphatase or phosphodiesterase